MIKKETAINFEGFAKPKKSVEKDVDYMSALQDEDSIVQEETTKERGVPAIPQQQSNG